MAEQLAKLQGSTPSEYLHSETLNVGKGRKAKPAVSAIGRRNRHVVHIVAQKEFVRAAMAKIVSMAGHLSCEFGDARELAEQRPAEGIVLAHESAECSAADSCRVLAEQGFWLPVIGFGADIAPRSLIAGMQAGVLDYLVGAVTKQELNLRLNECAQKARLISDQLRRYTHCQTLIDKLSPRERQVLGLVASGSASKEIAKLLSLSHRTVEIHRQNILNKMEAPSTVHAVRIWLDATIEHRTGTIPACAGMTRALECMAS